ncbi:aldehyde dehydrogenase family protein [bacterium]|nr:aldehyde dehydrogenase family protein [bacterium]
MIVAIGPFNYPVNLLLSKVIPALLTGNSVIYKSAHQTIQIGYLLATLFDQAKFPSGVINFLIANNEDLDSSVFNNKYVRLVNFTGGTKNGKEIANKLPFGIYKVFELGGLDPALITSYNDNPAKIAKEIIKGSFSYNGQRCTAIKRIILLKSNHTFNESFIHELVNMAQKLSVGKAIDNPDLTCLISNNAVKKVKALYDDALAKGATALLPFKNEGNLVYPIILDHVNNTMDIYHTEAFGPIVPIMYSSDINEMIKIANDTTYGLQASVFTNNQDE